MVEIVKGKKSEYEEILRFLEEAYGHSYNFFPEKYPQVWQKENTDYENILLLKENGQILSLVRIFPLEVIQDGVKTKIAGIGAVSTAFTHRGKGYMSKLLNKSFEKMKQDGYPLSILWGDRHRYINFGYEVAGRVIRLSLTARGFEKKGVKEVNAKRYLGEKKLLKKFLKTQSKNNYRKIRTEKEFEEIFKKIGTSTYYYDDTENFSYVIIEKNKVYEWGGDEKILLGILKYLKERFGITEFYMDFPSFETIPERIFEVASSWLIKPSGMIKIIDLHKTLSLFKNKINSSFPEGFELTLKMGDESVILKKEKGNLSIEKGKGKNLIELSEPEMVRLIMGTFFWAPPEIDEKTVSILKTFLPFNIFISQLDHI